MLRAIQAAPLLFDAASACDFQIHPSPLNYLVSDVPSHSVADIALMALLDREGLPAEEPSFSFEWMTRSLLQHLAHQSDHVTGQLVSQIRSLAFRGYWKGGEANVYHPVVPGSIAAVLVKKH